MENKKEQIEESVTFSGQEATKINLSEIYKAARKLVNPKIQNVVDNIVFNCDKDEFLNKLGVANNPIINNVVSNLYGLRVYKRGYVPQNEVWMCDKNGKIIKKFSI